MATSIVVLILFIAGIASVYGSIDGEVKFLTNDGTKFNSKYEGVVQVYWEGNWGGVCFDSIREAEATVICRSFGFRLATRWVNAKTDFPDHKNKNVTLQSLYCKGDELDLNSCTWNTDVEACSTRDVLALACSSVIDYALRLKGGTTWYEGRVEVYHEGPGHNHWGTVCNDFWGKADARVVCRQLGYGNPNKAQVSDGDYYKPGSESMPVLLDNVHCSGVENFLGKCPSNPWHNENCFFNRELAAVTCETATLTGKVTTGAIAGIVIASLVGLSFIIVLFCLCNRQSKKKKRNNRAAVVSNSGGAGGGVSYINQGGVEAGGVTFINPGQGQPPQQQVQYVIPGAASAYPPPYSPPGAAYGGDVGYKHDSANPGPTNN